MKYIIICILSILLIICCSSKRVENIILENTVINDTIVTQQNDSNKIYTFVEQMPSYPGGDAEMQRFIANNFKVPKIPLESGIQGRATIRFVVTKTGEIGETKAIRGDSIMCDSLMSVIKRMPRWIPGKHEGKNVDVYFTLPMHIHLKQ